MDRARIHEGIRRMRFTDVLGRSERSELSQMEAAELLGISERTFRRWRDPPPRKSGVAGLADRRLAPSLRRAPMAEIERMLGLYRDLYRGFTVKHFHEQLGKRHGYTLGYTVTKLHLHRAGLVQAATKLIGASQEAAASSDGGDDADIKTPRPMPGWRVATWAGMIQSVTHGRLNAAAICGQWTFLVDEEGTASSLRGVREVVAKHGLFCSTLY